MADPHIDKARRLLERTQPGPGGPDDGVPGGSLRLKSVPNVATERLQRHLEHLNQSLSPEGMRALDVPRRTLVHMGMTRKVIQHELGLRGHMSPQFDQGQR